MTSQRPLATARVLRLESPIRMAGRRLTASQESKCICVCQFHPFYWTMLLDEEESNPRVTLGKRGSLLANKIIILARVILLGYFPQSCIHVINITKYVTWVLQYSKYKIWRLELLQVSFSPKRAVGVEIEVSANGKPPNCIPPAAAVFSLRSVVLHSSALSASFH